MYKVFCDRCGEGINKTTHYLVRIYERDNSPSMLDCEATATTALQNLRDVFKSERQYCEKCKEEFEKILTNEPTVESIAVEVMEQRKGINNDRQ